MSYHYLQEPGGVFSLDAYLAGIRSERLKSSQQPEKCCSPANATESCPSFLFGTTFQPSMAALGEASSISLPEGSPARISAPPEKAKELPESAQAFGLKCTESFAKFDQNTRLWKTLQCSLLEGLDEYSETWPPAGIMLHGWCWELPTLARTITENASGYSHETYWPTPTCHVVKETGAPCEKARNTPGLGTLAAVGLLGTPGKLNPTWVEWLMGWPSGWTDCEPLETDKFRLWQQQHLIAFEKLSKP